MEQAAGTGQASFCWAATIDRHEQRFTLGGVDRGVAGYSPMREPVYFGTYAEAKAEAAKRNEAMGVTPREALDIVASSMRAQNLAEQARAASPYATR